MERSDREQEEDLAFLRQKLSLPKPEREAWLNAIVDAWISGRRVKKLQRKHVKKQ
jgi:hypothetical protein